MLTLEDRAWLLHRFQYRKRHAMRDNYESVAFTIPSFNTASGMDCMQ